MQTASADTQEPAQLFQVQEQVVHHEPPVDTIAPAFGQEWIEAVPMEFAGEPMEDVRPFLSPMHLPADDSPSTVMKTDSLPRLTEDEQANSQAIVPSGDDTAKESDGDAVMDGEKTQEIDLDNINDDDVNSEGLDTPPPSPKPKKRDTVPTGWNDVDDDALWEAAGGKEVEKAEQPQSLTQTVAPTPAPVPAPAPVPVPAPAPVPPARVLAPMRARRPATAIAPRPAPAPVPAPAPAPAVFKRPLVPTTPKPIQSASSNHCPGQSCPQEELLLLADGRGPEPSDPKPKATVDWIGLHSNPFRPGACRGPVEA